MEPWEIWVRSTGLSIFVLKSNWIWQVCETLHYFGLTMLLGTVGLYDLRMLGFAKRLPPAALHRLIPLGVAGFVINVITGVIFFSGYPEQYAYNNAFYFKVAFLALAGVNVVLFYTTVFKEVKTLGVDDLIPVKARVMAGVSLFSWVAVLICGRLLTFFRPPFYH